MARLLYRCFFFFFQAEDGIRDLTVTGVQTCALPISGRGRSCGGRSSSLRPPDAGGLRAFRRGRRSPSRRGCGRRGTEIGRGSCRGRGEISVGAVSLKKKKKKEIETERRRRRKERGVM